MAPPPKKKYSMLNQRDHVLKRPGLYIGSIQPDELQTWVLSGVGSMNKEDLIVCPGLLKIVDEILVNALDHCVRLIEKGSTRPVKDIRVTISKETGEISVLNSGEGVDVFMDDEHGIYIPEMIFGNLLSGSNFDDTEEKTVGGQNGIGSKAANIYSEWFEIETIDYDRKLIYTQRFEDNLGVKHPPTVKKSSKVPYTKISFLPDYKRFGYPDGKLSPDMYRIFEKRVYDLCACTPSNVKVFFNGVYLPFKDSDKYIEMYIGTNKENPRASHGEARWEVIASARHPDSPGFEQVSFVNGINTYYGGKHVDYISNQICKKMADMIMAKRKIKNIRPAQVKDNMFLYVKCTIVNPSFDSQSKERLTTISSKFGSKCEIPEKFIEKLYKTTDIADMVTKVNEAIDSKNMAKTDGKKQNTIRGIPKLQDAIWAGTSKSEKTTLILCEGDSAATFCTSGLAVVGRNEYGVFPLRGKVLNVNDASSDKIANNAEIANLKKILGLVNGMKYDKTSELATLRYGRIMILTDADVDGSHIKGLIFNMFMSMWPTLYKKDGFLCTMLTPIVKVTKGKSVKEFYNMRDYEEWKAIVSAESGWVHKYYKGLGTSSANEARDLFKGFNCVDYIHDEKSDSSMNLAFHKKNADERKAWISSFDKNTQMVIGPEQKSVSYDDFIHKELLDFAVYSVDRAIPSLVDGMKRSTRKILFSAFKRNLTKEIKVAQFSGYVSENSCYHHGEASLQSSIIGMAQNYVGSNNINMFMPSGQFGTRIQGGKDAASPRYIFTYLNPTTRLIFPKEDDIILEFLEDDGTVVEPTFYMPIIPMILVNGCCGVATGFSTSIPSYSPLDLIDRIECILENEEADLEPLVPWYKGFRGMISSNENDKKFMSKGIWNRLSTVRLEITELPVGMWTNDYIEFLEKFIDTSPDILKDFQSHHTDELIKFVLTFQKKEILDNLCDDVDKLETTFKLVSTACMSQTNMHLFDENMKVTKFNDPRDIIRAYFPIRLDGYKRRKEAQLTKMDSEIKLLLSKVRFIQDVVDEVIIIANTPIMEITSLLEVENYEKVNGSYDYLISLPIRKLTMEEKTMLENSLDEMMKARDTLYNTNEKSIWKHELDELRKKI